jgi:hypothetical protein
LRNRWLGAVIVLATVAAVVLQGSVVARTGFLMGDFRAFYCAARVTAHHDNPYHSEPLRACEASSGGRGFMARNPGVTIPAPLPGYVIGALVPLALLPFRVAALVWVALLVAAWLLGVVALSKFASAPWEVALAATSLALGALSLAFGEVVPIAVAGICGAAYFAQQARWRAAAICSAVAMVEPHLGLSVCIALVAFAPPSRVTLLVALVALGAFSLIVLGPAANIEYLTSVLPAHALSEATRDTQYSLTAVLTALGIPVLAAAKAGALWYLGMLAAGTLVAGRLARQTKNAACLACVPPAFAVFGGTFIHITQIAAAIPAALLLAENAREHYKNLAVVALLLLSVPWGWVVSPALILGPVFPVAYLAWRYWSSSISAVLLAGILAAIAILSLANLYAVHGLHLAAPASAPVIDSRLPEASWSAYSRRTSSASIASWAVRIPSWSGLILLLTLLTLAAREVEVRAGQPLRYLPREVS